MWLIALLCLCVVLVILYLCLAGKRYKLPPGPSGYPLIGNIFEITNVELLHRDLTRLHKQHGDIVYLRMLNKPFVSLSSLKLLREAFLSGQNAKILADRPPSFLGKHVMDNSNVTLVDYSVASGRRKVLHKLLHQYGEGIPKLEHLVNTETDRFMKEIRDLDCKPFEPSEMLFNSLFNVICILSFGCTYDSGHVVRKALRTSQAEMNYLFTGGIDTLLSYLPFLSKLPFRFRAQLERCIEARRLLRQIFFKEQKESFDPKSPRGVVDEMFIHQLTQKQEDKCILTDSNIFEMTQEIFGAGIMTTQGTLTGMLLVFLHYPDVQRKLQSECDTILCEGRRPTLSDRKRMPYTQATITEAFRFLSTLPVSIPHFSASDTKLSDFDIPAGTTILQNLWGVDHDERLWDRPFQFVPERFLDSTGAFMSPDDPVYQRVMVFGLGKRACPGEVFARARLFLYLTALMSSFTFVPGNEEDIPSCDPRNTIPGVITTYPSFTVKAIPRRN